MKTPTEKSCLTTALRLLGRRDHSCLELSQKLKQRDFSNDVIESVIADCLKMNYLDDERFCEGFTDQLRRRGYGVLRIAQKLKDKGVAAAHIQNSIERHCPEAAQIDDCRRVLKKKLASRLTDAHGARDRSRLFRFLYHRGFSSEVIVQALNEAPGFENTAF